MAEHHASGTLVGSLAEARVALIENRYDLIVVDGVLPDGLGLDLVSSARAARQPPRFIFLSAYWRRTGGDLPTARDMGVDALLHKPFSEQELVGCMERLWQEVRRRVAQPPPRRRHSDRAVFSQSLQKVRGSFAKTLSGRVEELALAVAAACDQPVHARFERALTLATKLQATAGTYGFAELGFVAREIGESFDELVAGITAVSELLWHRLEVMVARARDIARGAASGPTRPQVPSMAIVADHATAAATLLVVDANLSFLSACEVLGRELLHRIVTARDGQEALAAARCTRLDGALINISVDEAGGGIRLANQLREVSGGAALPVAFVTDHDSMANRVAATAVEADLFVAKPLDKQTFADVARHLLRTREARTTKVLLADHDLERRASLAAELAKAELEVVTVDRADELLESLARQAPDLVFIAEDLPPWSGASAIRAIRMMPQHMELPLLMTGAADQSKSRIAAAAAGADDMLAVGIEAEELVARVRLRLERRAEQRVQRERDTLTGLLLRRAFVERFNGRLAELRRTRGQVSVALLDLDHFKRINDDLGHLVGDRVLANFGHFLENSMRTEDLLCRWGGEEFVVACFEQDAETMRTIVTRGIKNFRAQRLKDDLGQPFQASFSGGVATWPADGDDLVVLMKRADERLYEAKRAGRGRVV